MTSTIVTRILKLENCWIQDSIKKNERKERKKILETRNLYEDTNSIVGNILTRRIQRYQRRSPMMIGMNHTNSSKASEHWYILTTIIAYFIHYLWYFCVIGFVLLRFFQQYHWYVIEVSKCLPYHFLYFSFLSTPTSFSFFFYWILCNNFLIWEFFFICFSLYSSLFFLSFFYWILGPIIF